ncbi:MAG: DUF4388 domain-containing protein [Phototrophicaceae bacterium]
MPLQANLQDISPTQVLNLVNLAGKTGMLTVYEGIATGEMDAMNKPKQKAGDERCRIAFKGGKLIHATAGADQESDLIAVLNRAGKLSDSQVKIIRERAKSSSDKAIALLLINANYATQNDIVTSIQQHMLEVVHNMLTWRDGPFRFDDDTMPSSDRILVPLDVENIILEYTRRAKENDQLMRELPDLNVSLKFPENAKEKFKGVHLSVEEWRVVSFVNPKNSIKQIAKANNMSDMEIRRIVYGLMMANLVQVMKPDTSGAGAAKSPAASGASAAAAATKQRQARKAQVQSSVVNKLIDKIKSL